MGGRRESSDSGGVTIRNSGRDSIREYGTSRARSVGREELVGSPLREDGSKSCHRSDHSIPTARRPARGEVTAVTQIAGADDSEARGGER